MTDLECPRCGGEATQSIAGPWCRPCRLREYEGTPAPGVPAMTDQYKCLLMDPPWWAEKGGGKIKRGADRHYPLMKNHDIIETILRDPLWRPADDSHLWMCVTNTTMCNGDALHLMRAFGFAPKTVATWVKTNGYGLGQYLRGKTEHVLIGVRGRGASIRTGTGVSYFEAKRTKHSAKPVEMYEMIEKVSPGPRVEFFARARREGWDAMGNETEVDYE